MGYNDIVLSIIQSKLNTIIASIPDCPIVFDGEVSFYDADWIKKKVELTNAKQVVPYALVLENGSAENEGQLIIENNYGIAFLCSEKYQDLNKYILETLFDELMDFKHAQDGVTYVFKPIESQRSELFNNGSGGRYKSYEYAIRFGLTIFSGVKFGSDFSFKFADLIIPFRSFKITHGISAYAKTPTSPYSDNENFNINKTQIIIETFLTDDSAVLELIKIKNNVNDVNNFVIEINNSTFYDDSVIYEGYEMGVERNGVATIFLYFTAKQNNGEPNRILIDGLDFPVIDYSITVKNNTRTIGDINSNITREVYLGKSRAYVFNVLKSKLTSNLPLYHKLLSNLMSDGSFFIDEYLTLSFTFGSTTYTKQVLLMEMEDVSANKGYWKIVLSEGKNI